MLENDADIITDTVAFSMLESDADIDKDMLAFSEMQPVLPSIMQ